MTLALVVAPARVAAAAPETCGGGLTGIVCSGAHGLANGAKKIPGVGGLIEKAEGAYKTVDALSPSNFLDSWAQGLSHAVIFTLTFIQSTADQLGKPAFDQKWWQAQYAVSFGLALFLLAFLLPVVTARIGGPEGSVGGIELLRKSGWRLIFVVQACAFAPALMYSLEQLAAALTKTFATSSAVEAKGAVGGLLKALEEKAGNGWGDFGGTVMCIVLMLGILIAGVILLIEVAISNWGVMLCGLLVPLGLIAAVYPPWARILKRIMGIIVGLMFLPPVIFFFFWTIWSAFNVNVNGQGGSNSTVTMMIYLLVALLMLDAFPLVAVWLMSIVAPGTEQMDPSVRGLAPQPTMGEVSSNTFEKPLMGGEPTWDGAAQGGDGGGGSGDTGDSDSGDNGDSGDGDSGDGDSGETKSSDNTGHDNGSDGDGSDDSPSSAASPSGGDSSERTLSGTSPSGGASSERTLSGSSSSGGGSSEDGAGESGASESGSASSGGGNAASAEGSGTAVVV
ncbi:hypothetical protein [Streptomyces sp. NPDC053726]|uniref:hypothetical protein n=1 Tax=Streptomyces sp. NPDC053726 TaxID=3365713 RepID=UPI0037D13B86